ncbi:MAG: hypothetical protein KF774_18535 [Planctomyces sp.]|nr:hypothetical protein [Planctomyces sp.]
MQKAISAAILAGSLVLALPAAGQAGVIPWVYDAIFGYGHHGWGAPAYPAYGPGYGYASWGAAAPPIYTASYAPYVAPVSYAPATYYYGGLSSPACPSGNCGYANYGPAGCCVPVDPCCNPCCGSPCGPGGCADCTTDGTVGSGSSSSGDDGPTPTYVPPTRNEPPREDGFERARRSLDEEESGSVPRSGSGTDSGTRSGSSVPPEGTGRPPFAPADPGSDANGNEDLGTSPSIAPLDDDVQVAFVAPARFTRVRAEPRFSLPTTVQAAARVHRMPGMTAPSAAVAKN